MQKLDWIKDLVRAEQQMEESGIIDFNAGFDAEQALQTETVAFMNDMKAAFVEAASAFNQMKSSQLGNIKIYSISKTQADFMLFRNGYKLIFTMKYPGAVAIRFQTMTPNFIPGEAQNDVFQGRGGFEEDLIQSQWGAFAELSWTFREQPLKLDNMVRFYMSRFIRDSAK
jgi:hypothetical protein